ncbi:hypothetical protein ACFSQQ_27765 [Mesorhizobium kowhaii]|uniref:hypothetical protein n=1 Tax=Mesorhizobium kowhaii TaxID=1300272 RepID=UPI0035E8FF12
MVTSILSIDQRLERQFFAIGSSIYLGLPQAAPSPLPWRFQNPVLSRTRGSIDLMFRRPQAALEQLPHRLDRFIILFSNRHASRTASSSVLSMICRRYVRSRVGKGSSQNRILNTGVVVDNGVKDRLIDAPGVFLDLDATNAHGLCIGKELMREFGNRNNVGADGRGDVVGDPLMQKIRAARAHFR